MPFDIEGAKKAGYSDAEIADHLGKESGFDVAAARKAGYSDAELLTHLAKQTKQPEGPLDLLTKGIRDAASITALLPPISMMSRAAGIDLSPPESMGGQIRQNLIPGAIRGAGSIGATILAPADVASDLSEGKGLSLDANRERRAKMDLALQNLGANPESGVYQASKLGTEVAGTLGVGPALAATAVKAGIPAAAPVIDAVRTAGMTGGGVVPRTIGGAVTGGASAGLVDPKDAATGAAIGGVLPGAIKVAGETGNAVGRFLRGSVVSPERAALAQRAEQLGIDIPADRLVDSKPLNALASALNYVPFSGRAGTEAKMASQLNQAASKLMGQNTSNINEALRKADVSLGAKFESTLRNNGVTFDQQLLNDVSRVYNTAEKELGSDALKAISSQVDDLIEKGASGVIDGQAAYNIKRTLDRIGKRDSPEAFHALELKGVLMDALNRSLGKQGAADFALTRQQYGNMLSLEKLAKNGVEGEISVARLANLPNINNNALQELADIAATFVKSREGQHGAMQRAVVGLGTGVTMGVPGMAGVVAAGRGTNALLNSNLARNAALGNPLALPNSQLGYRIAPVIGADQ